MVPGKWIKCSQLHPSSAQLFWDILLVATDVGTDLESQHTCKHSSQGTRRSTDSKLTWWGWVCLTSVISCLKRSRCPRVPPAQCKKQTSRHAEEKSTVYCSDSDLCIEGSPSIIIFQYHISLLECPLIYFFMWDLIYFVVSHYVQKFHGAERIMILWPVSFRGSIHNKVIFFPVCITVWHIFLSFSYTLKAKGALKSVKEC